MITVLSIVIFLLVFGAIGIMLLGGLALVIDLIMALLPYILVIAIIVVICRNKNKNKGKGEQLDA